MKLAENPAKVGRIISVVVVVTIVIGAINFLVYFMNSSGSQSTVLNSLIMYACLAILAACVVLAVVVNVANKRLRNAAKQQKNENIFMK